jgi:ubiquinone/menaquinone biosynthesis C-methylase UbiE
VSDGDPADGVAEACRSPERVREVYDRIAAHFAETRHHAWPETREFLEGARGRVGLDIGCGNGRHTELLAERVARAVGLDISRGLLAEARDRAVSVELVQGDAASLPVATGAVDLAVYVATIHHLPDRPTRRGSLAELARVLTPGGRALVSAWSTAHERFDADPGAEVGFDTTVDWTLPGGETVDRFYHIYTPAEFEADVAASPLAVESTYLSSGNCYAVVGK